MDKAMEFVVSQASIQGTFFNDVWRSDDIEDARAFVKGAKEHAGLDGAILRITKRVTIEEEIERCTISPRRRTSPARYGS